MLTIDTGADKMRQSLGTEDADLDKMRKGTMKALECFATIKKANEMIKKANDEIKQANDTGTAVASVILECARKLGQKFHTMNELVDSLEVQSEKLKSELSDNEHEDETNDDDVSE